MTSMTYVQAIDNALEIIDTALATDPSMWENLDVTRNKLEALKAQLVKRSGGSRKPSKAQVANESLKVDIVSALTERKTATEVAKQFDISNQKASALLTALVKADTIERTVEKGKAYFQAVA